MKLKLVYGPSHFPLFICAICMAGMMHFPLFTVLGQTPDKSKIKATASSWERKEKGGFGDFPPEATLDGNLDSASSWRSEGKEQWIQYDLGEIKHLEFIELAFVGGDKRVYTFDILVSKTGLDKEWTSAALKVASSGTTLSLERFKFAPVDVRHIRLVGHGNTSPKFPHWFNITEVSFVNDNPIVK